MAVKNNQTRDDQPRLNELITFSEAAEKSGFTPRHLRYLAENGELWAKKLGRNWFTTTQAVDRPRLLHVTQFRLSYCHLDQLVKLRAHPCPNPLFPDQVRLFACVEKYNAILDLRVVLLVISNLFRPVQTLGE
jgi:hypothetical protein